MFQVSDLFQLIQVFATIGLVYYAYVTIREAKRDRRKNTIERMLENVYSPMLEILTRARSEKIGRRDAIRKTPAANGVRDYVVMPQEFDDMRNIVERFSYYIGSPELERLRLDLESFEYVLVPYKPEEGPVPWYRYDTNVFDNHWRFFNARCKELTAELDGLVNLSNSLKTN